jgi:hypothetical protein
MVRKIIVLDLRGGRGKRQGLSPCLFSYFWNFSRFRAAGYEVRTELMLSWRSFLV